MEKVTTLLINARNNAHLLLTATLLVASLSLLEPLMGWILILVICSVVMRLALYLQLQKHLPTVRTLNLLALLSAIVLAWFSFQLGLLRAMLNLLVLACSLKLMVMRSTRDYYQLVAALMFVVGCGFIFQQSMAFAALYSACAVALLLSLAWHISPSLRWRNQMRQVGVLSLQAIPVAVLLFIVLPKLGPLWQMPTSRPSQTGLSDVVSPGDIAELSQSSKLAFRATFEGDLPPPQQRYWRALVLEGFDGKSWFRARQRLRANDLYRQFNQEFSPSVSGPFYDYQVFAEPSGQRWLFMLDVGIPADAKTAVATSQSPDYQLASQVPVMSPMQYAIRSYPQVLLNQVPLSIDRRINLQTPEAGNPQTREWVNSLRQRWPDDRDFVAAVMNYFPSNNFRYTLRPDSMPDNPVDRFLFGSRAGFCAHYASAMAYALRLGGIPARMVTGYQGGEQSGSDYVSIYQYDAHAWVEAWIDERGWQRFDPTATVAPDRIQFGLQAAVAEEGSFLADSPFALARLKQVAWLNELRMALADLDYLWSRWVLGFDSAKQRDLFKSLLGKLTPQRLALFTFSVFVFIGLLLTLYYLPIWRTKRRSRSAVLFAKVETLLSKHQIQRQPWQAALGFLQDAQKTLPPHAQQIMTRIVTRFNRLEFGQVADKAENKRQHLLLARDIAALKQALSQ